MSETSCCGEACMVVLLNCPEWLKKLLCWKPFTPDGTAVPVASLRDRCWRWRRLIRLMGGHVQLDDGRFY